MATNQDELRESLVAVIEASPELPKADREHLADVFLDQLNASYDLVPRGSGSNIAQSGNASGNGTRHRPWVPIALLLVFLLFVVPAALHHFPIFLLIGIVLFFAWKSGRLDMVRRWTA